MLANRGGGNQEAYPLRNTTGDIDYVLSNLAMSAIALVASHHKPSLIVRIAAAPGCRITLLRVVLSVFPRVKVANAGGFTAQIIMTVADLQSTGAL